MTRGIGIGGSDAPLVLWAMGLNAALMVPLILLRKELGAHPQTTAEGRSVWRHFLDKAGEVFSSGL